MPWWFIAGAFGLGVLVTAVVIRTGASPVPPIRTAAPVATPTPAPPVAGTTQPPAAAASALMSRLGQVAGVVVGAADEGVLVSFAEPLFASGSAAVGAAEAALVDRLAAVLRTPGARVLWVRGYTDPHPTRPGGRWTGNDALALARARSVASRLAGDQAPVSIASPASEAAFHDRDFSARSRTVVLYVLTRPRDPFAADVKTEK